MLKIYLIGIAAKREGKRSLWNDRKIIVFRVLSNFNNLKKTEQLVRRNLLFCRTTLYAFVQYTALRRAGDLVGNGMQRAAHQLLEIGFCLPLPRVSSAHPPRPPVTLGS